MGIIPNPDGSIIRTVPDFLADVPASSDPHQNSVPVITKDISINQENKTWVRVYLPLQEPDHVFPNTNLLLIVYFHGGGFILRNPATSVIHNLCLEMANEVRAVIVSVEYRLAPEHRLPAAYDDCVGALHWIKTTSDDWLTGYVDFSYCLLMGSSAGGTIAYHVGLRAINLDLEPLKIQGLILHQPFFGGVHRTPSEVRLAYCEDFPISLADIMWDLSLPVGSNQDHEYCNPMVGIKSDFLEKMKDQRWKVLVTGCDGDPLMDRQIEFVEMLKKRGLDVSADFSDGGGHGCEFFDNSKAKILYGVVNNFVLSV